MPTSFRVVPLLRETFAPLFQLTTEDLAAKGMRRLTADKKPYYPCRISLVDAEPGEQVLMLSYTHQAVYSPHRACGAIFVREDATDTVLAVGELPEMLHHRLMSIRAYDSTDSMVGAEVIDGLALKSQIEEFFADPRVHYLHLHNAKIGCFFCRVDRA